MVDFMSKSEIEPRYRQIAENLRQRIRSGDLEPGQRLPSFPSMRAQGISQNTMEKVYSLLEADGAIERSMGRGIYVARTGALKPASLRGIIGIPGHSDDYDHTNYGERVCKGIQAAAYEQGYGVLLTKEFELTRLAKLDGVVWVGPGLEKPLASLPPTMPWVSVLSILQEAPEVPCLLVDEPSGVRAAIEHLFRLGHRRIAYLVVHWADGEHKRHTAYRDALLKAGIEPDPRWVRPLFVSDRYETELGFAGHGYDAMQRWLREDWKELDCTAILAHNDEAALGVLRALREVGLRVPGDVSVVGFDGTIAAVHADPPLTTIDVPLYEIGALGTRMLLELIENEGPPPKPGLHVLPVQLRIGQSTAPPKQNAAHN